MCVSEIYYGLCSFFFNLFQILFKVFKKSGVDMNKPIVASCMTGMTASSLAFVADLLGLKEVSVYAVTHNTTQII